MKTYSINNEIPYHGVSHSTPCVWVVTAGDKLDTNHDGWLHHAKNGKTAQLTKI